jgi:hypothetical protein
VLRKKVLATAVGKEAGSRANTKSPESKPLPLRKDSETTAGTEIEEDTTPAEEVERYLWTPPTDTITQNRTYQEPRSPISNLKYPTIPRPAAVSRQAEIPAVPAPVLLPTTGTGTTTRPTRDQLVRDGSSFMVTDTTSDALSDRSINWPVPPNLRDNPFQTPTRSGLRENPYSANRGLSQRSTDQMQYGPRTSSLVASPVGTRANFKPSTNSRGDMMFTVEM